MITSQQSEEQPNTPKSVDQTRIATSTANATPAMSQNQWLWDSLGEIDVPATFGKVDVDEDAFCTDVFQYMGFTQESAEGMVSEMRESTTLSMKEYLFDRLGRLWRPTEGVSAEGTTVLTPLTIGLSDQDRETELTNLYASLGIEQSFSQTCSKLCRGDPLRHIQDILMGSLQDALTLHDLHCRGIVRGHKSNM
jgi:hypothetical protein